MTTYYDQDKVNSPEDYLQLSHWKSKVTFTTVEEMNTCEVNLDFDAVVELQQELGQWLLECKENQCE